MKYTYITTEKTMLAEAVKRAVPLLKKGRERSLISEREVKVNGVRTVADALLAPGDSVEVFAPAAYIESRDVRIIYEDGDIVVADKPVKTESETELPSILKDRCGTLIPVHRLDTNTTGLIILAKNGRAADALKAAFKSPDVKKGRTSPRGVGFAASENLTSGHNAYAIKKTYIATVCGMPKPTSGVIRSRLIKDAHSGRVSSKPIDMPGGVIAETRYEVISGNGDLYKVKLEPKTGRTHQLRVHMAEIGCPILGDGKYGNFAENKKRGAAYQELRAVRLELINLPVPLTRLNGKIFTTDDYHEKEENKPKA